MLRLLDIWTISTFLIYFVDVVQCRVTYNSGDIEHNQPSCNSSDGKPCAVGHCCGGDHCCTYYYELWWFWLIWGLIILISCCCAYHHRQKRREQRTRRHHPVDGEAYAGVCNYPGPPLDNNVLGYCKLPVYNDVMRIPPTASPPPPYSSRRRPINTIACIQPNDRGETAMTIIPCNITSSMLSLASLSHYIPSLLAQNAIPAIRQTNNRDEDVVLHDDNNNQTNIQAKDQQAEKLPEKCEPISMVEASMPVHTIINVDPPVTDLVDLNTNPSSSSQEGCSYEVDTLLGDSPCTHGDDYSSTDDSGDEEWAFGVDPNNNNSTKSWVSDDYHPPVGSSLNENLLSTYNRHDNSDIVLHLTPREDL